MSKLIRSTTPHKPATRASRRPIYVIASGGEVFIAKRTRGALTWVPATEANFGVPPSPAANEAHFGDPGQS